MWRNIEEIVPAVRDINIFKDDFCRVKLSELTLANLNPVSLALSNDEV